MNDCTWCTERQFQTDPGKIGLNPGKVLEILKKGTNPVKLGDKHLTVQLSEKSSSPKWQKGSINLA